MKKKKIALKLDAYPETQQSEIIKFIYKYYIDFFIIFSYFAKVLYRYI